MFANTRRFSWGRRLALGMGLVVSPAVAWGSPSDGSAVQAAVAEARHVDPSIRRALSLLSTPVSVPIDVVDIARLPIRLRREVRLTCAFVQIGISRINVISSCPVYRLAENSLLDAMKLAALLQHELAHVGGAGELQGRLVELRTFRELIRHAPASDLTQCMVYAAAIERHAAAAPIANAARQALR
jgi:hypothetical protein